MTNIPGATEIFIEANGIRHHLLDWGNPKAPNLFLVHGWDGNAHYFDRIAPNFKDRFHVVAVTLRGRGKSGEDPTGIYDFYDYVKDLSVITKVLEMEKLTFVGGSLGGMIGIAFTVDHQDQVEKLVMVDIGAQLGDGKSSTNYNKVEEAPESFDSLEEAESWLRKFSNYMNLPALSIKICLREHFRETENGKWVWSYAHRLRKLRAEYTVDQLFPKQWDKLDKIKCPTLVIHAANSQLTLEEVAKKTAEDIESGKFIQIANTSHFPFLEVPEEFTKVVKSFVG